MKINFLKYRTISFILSLILIIGSVSVLFIFGLKPSIDFTGGSILEIEYSGERPTTLEIRQSLSNLNLGEIVIQPTGEKGMILKMKELSEKTHQAILEKLKEGKEIKELRFDSIGPTIGKELKEKTKLVISLSLLAMVLYIAFAFRNLNYPAKPWQYGIASLFLLSFNVLIPLGALSILGEYYGVQMTVPVIVALLTIIGYTINNVVVVYDRLRENILLTRRQNQEFEQTANLAINQTLNRQINTSLTTLFPLAFIFFLGGETLKYFSLTLILGLVFGLFSSIFLAVPLLVSWLKWQKRI